MPKVRIFYPQIIYVNKSLEIPQEQVDQLGEEHHSIVDFIWNQMTMKEQEQTNGKDWIRSAYESDYAGLNVLPEKS